MAKVVIEKVSKIYPGKVTAVREFSAEIADGEFVVLVGPSGCGKSTVLRMVAGLEEISSGTIRIGERVVNDVPPKDRDIAMVFQNYALYPHMTVQENMAFGLKLRGMPRKEIATRVDEAAAILGLESLLERRPKALSGGQRQRVALGRAIVRKPAVFLFDEPLSNLDAKMRVQMRMEISQIHQRLGVTMIYVTHDQVEAMTMGQRIVVMKDGVIQQVATPLRLYDQPVNRFVAGFIGTPPMNIIEGTVRGEGDSLCFEGSGGLQLPVPAEACAALAAFCERPVALGLRPEDIGSPSAESLAGAPRLRAGVEVIEQMGSESYVYLRIGDVRLVCRMDAHRPLKIGETITPAVCMSRARFFDPANGERIGGV
ncbi:MAG: ABC transporter ATP-binding protein [Kiritimatiellia bacterium]